MAAKDQTQIMADKAFVGLLRGTVNAQGEDVVNIGAVMEYGATTQTARRLLSPRGRFCIR